MEHSAGPGGGLQIMYGGAAAALRARSCVNDAAEHVVAARAGGYAVYVDSGTLGKPGTGGNFGLVVLAPDTAPAAVLVEGGARS